MNIRWNIVFSFFISSVLLSRPPLANLNSDNIKFIRTQEKESCHINFITIDGQLFLVKQKKKLTARKVLGSVREALTAYIAENFIDLAHKVDIIPAGKKMPGKICVECPATLHSIAPGKAVRGMESPYKQMDIRQKVTGFNRAMLKWMAKHPELITIVALDTFLCNGDRHRANIFYNKEDDSFCAIDMESSYRHNYCQWACNNWSEIMNDSSCFLTKSEVNILSEYIRVLELLINKYNSKKVIKKYYDFLAQAGFPKNHVMINKGFKEGIKHNIRIIQESYQDAKRLIIILKSLIKRSKKK